jgi:hypothetical protein
MNRSLFLVLLLACVGGFVLGILELFKLRFESGDVYPAYSTLRADPLGTSAFYESLEQMPGITAIRDYRMSDQLPEGSNVAYLHLAGHYEEWNELPEDTFREIGSFLRGGGRLVVALYPENGGFLAEAARARRTNDLTGAKRPGENDPTNSVPFRSSKPRKKRPSGIERPFATVSVKDRWGLEFRVLPLAKEDEKSYRPVDVVNPDGDPSLPHLMSWHSGLVLTNLDKAWRVIYSRRSSPVLVERRFGPGSVVFATDSYFLSNEAMEKDRHADLLAWLVGSSRQVFFDEAHLGIVQEPGVATLVRKYRLHGLVAGLVFLAGLFIWKNMAPLAPPWRNEQREAFVEGKDSAAGFVNLLRRNVPASDVMKLCFAEWQKSLVRGKYSAARLARVQAVMDAENARAPRERNALQTYQSIRTILREGGGARDGRAEQKSPPPTAERHAT